MTDPVSRSPTSPLRRPPCTLLSTLIYVPVNYQNRPAVRYKFKFKLSLAMHFPTKLVDKLKPKGYVKPPIEVEKYTFIWNEVSFGIPPKETSNFNVFIRDAVPILDVLLHQVRQAQKIGEINKYLDTYQLSEAFNPMSSLVKSASHSGEYIIVMAWDGHIFIDRKESIYGNIEKNETLTNSYYHSQLDLSWNLGELVRKSM